MLRTGSEIGGRASIVLRRHFSLERISLAFLPDPLRRESEVDLETVGSYLYPCAKAEEIPEESFRQLERSPAACSIDHASHLRQGPIALVERYTSPALWDFLYVEPGMAVGCGRSRAGRFAGGTGHGAAGGGIEPSVSAVLSLQTQVQRIFRQGGMDMSILGAIIVPHPPLIVPTVGRGREREVQATIDAYRTAARQAAVWEPEVLIVTSPHQIMYDDYFHISPGRGAAGDMSAFGASQTRLQVEYDAPLREELVRRAEDAGLRAGTLGERDPSLDHGTFLPLYFLQEAGVDCPILRVGLSGSPPLDHYRLGQCIAQAVEALGCRAVFAASGDLSHKLREDGPYGFAPEGPEFDRQVTEAMADGDFLRFLTMDPALCERAAECGLRSFQIMAGALDGQAVEAKLLSYEGVTGVGYGVATFTVTGPDEGRRFGTQYEAVERARLAEKKASEDPWVKLARLSLETFVKTGKRLERLPEDLPAGMTEQTAGAFVSLHAHGRLRGCIGTTGPTMENVAWEIVQNAVSACSRDPRFPPVAVSELDSLEYSVDVLGRPEPVSSPAELDVKKFGVIVSCGGRRGLLLPDLEGVDTVERQIDIARQKGGIKSWEKYALERFKVVRHT